MEDSCSLPTSHSTPICSHHDQSAVYETQIDHAPLLSGTPQCLLITVQGKLHTFCAKVPSVLGTICARLSGWPLVPPGTPCVCSARLYGPLFSSCLCTRCSLILECPCSQFFTPKVLPASSSAFSASHETVLGVFPMCQDLFPQEASLPEWPLSMGLPLSLADSGSLRAGSRSHCILPLPPTVPGTV